MYRKKIYINNINIQTHTLCMLPSMNFPVPNREVPLKEEPWIVDMLRGNHGQAADKGLLVRLSFEAAEGGIREVLY